MADAIGRAEFYHITTRGNGRQILFERDDDRHAILRMLERQLNRTRVTVLAWCLMDNHIHLLLRDPHDELVSFMQGLLTSYARYFNGRTGHVGHVFQNRFGRSPISDMKYLLTAVRYIHLNPETAGIAVRDKYRWSSFGEYAGTRRLGITDTSVVIQELGSQAGFLEWSLNSQLDDEPWPALDRIRWRRGEELRAAAAALREMGVNSPQQVKRLKGTGRKRALMALSRCGLSIRQIERVTGIGKSSIARALASIR